VFALRHAVEVSMRLDRARLDGTLGETLESLRAEAHAERAAVERQLEELDHGDDPDPDGNAG